MNRSEAFVYKLAESTFLSLWTYPNPLRPGGKELTDVLVVCQPDIVIVSVKEIELKTGGNRETVTARWLKRAVDASVNQIYGAERTLPVMSHVIQADGQAGVAPGNADQRCIHRVAVAIGSDGSIPIESRDFGKGFVHVFDEQTVYEVLNELDTVTDVIQYLLAREALFKTHNAGVLIGTEEDLLGAYLTAGRTFDRLLDGDYHLRILEGVWDGYKSDRQVLAKKEADKVSYVWDNLIDTLHQDYLNGQIEYGTDLDSMDRTTRTMARESRFARRYLGNTFLDFLGRRDVRGRFLMAESGVGYVFLKAPHDEDRKYRAIELQARCVVARDEMDKQGRSGIVIGIATEIPEKGSGFSLDTVYLDVPEWTEELREKARKAREDLGFFRTPRYTKTSVDEYPS